MPVRVEIAYLLIALLIAAAGYAVYRQRLAIKRRRAQYRSGRPD